MVRTTEGCAVIDFHQLARDVDAFGLENCQGTLNTLGDLAGRVGVSPVLINVMLDGHEPDVARVRALARVQAEMGRRTPTLIAA
jgi:hypothetical protein